MFLPQLLRLALLAVGGYCCCAGGRRLATVFHVLRNDPRPVRDLHGHRGPVEVAGRAVGGDDGTVEAPFTGGTRRMPRGLTLWRKPTLDNADHERQKDRLPHSTH